jgi:hypothetical protein
MAQAGSGTTVATNFRIHHDAAKQIGVVLSLARHAKGTTQATATLGAKQATGPCAPRFTQHFNSKAALITCFNGRESTPARSRDASWLVGNASHPEIPIHNPSDRNLATSLFRLHCYCSPACSAHPIEGLSDSCEHPSGLLSPCAAIIYLGVTPYAFLTARLITAAV